MKLVSVYRLPRLAPQLLYKLLEERDAAVNISHRRMPTWKEHLAFIASRPYTAWYLMRVDETYVGAIYLSKQNEIGLFVLASCRGNGYGRSAVRALMAKHPRSRYLANINPDNKRAVTFFKQFGIQLIQHTYEFKAS